MDGWIDVMGWGCGGLGGVKVTESLCCVVLCCVVLCCAALLQAYTRGAGASCAPSARRLRPSARSLRSLRAPAAPLLHDSTGEVDLLLPLLCSCPCSVPAAATATAAAFIPFDNVV